ncbi:MAG: flagellar protein FlaG [Desulfobulbaceae bacterium]|uniref:Flagellar protein FlaG n=1 Tax=Candidatus Desulfobia pelagia TaxID=2841692 RepID=A0A8J6NCD5_9BACT|nr:flagellar protein FlaG [Candidatus Desulfobia pelagia]
MNIDASAAVKSIAQPVVPNVETVDKAKPQVAPVEKSGDSARAAQDERALRDKQQEKLTNEELTSAVENIQARLDVMRTKLGFSIHEETDDIVIKVTDRESGDVIRQIPSEEVMELRARLDELVGIIFDKKA